MFNLIIQQQVNNDFISWVSFGADLCILGITIYTTWKTFFEKRIKLLSYSPHFSMFGGDSISIVVKNSSLLPISVQSIDIIYSDHSLNLSKFDNFLILEPHHTVKIKMEPFSKLSKPLSELDINNFFIAFDTTEETIISKFRWIKTKYDKKKKYTKINIERKTFNGQIITPDIKYALLIKINNTEQTIFINDGGLLSSDIYGYNAIPKKDINDIEKVKMNIKGILNKYNQKQEFQLATINYQQLGFFESVCKIV